MAPAVLRRQDLSERHRGFGGDHAVERARGVALARLVVQHQRDLAFHRIAVVVVRQAGRGDAETRKHQPARHAPAGAEAVRVVIVSSLQLQRDAVVDDLARILRAERRHRQVERQEIRALLAGGREPEALESRFDELGRQGIAPRPNEAALGQIVREKVECRP